MLLRSHLLLGLRGGGFLHAFPGRDTAEAELLGALEAAAIVQVKQVHGARVVEAGGASEEADAVIGRAACAPPGGGRLAVGVRVADCVPVLLADPQTGDVAAVHAGWRGVHGGVVGAAVEALGGRALVAAIGPCIEACCFEVGMEVAARLGFVVREAGGKAFVDLRAAVRSQLRRAGLADDHIEDVPGCTKHDARLHSFRRDGANSGRMLAAIAARPLAG